MSRRPSGYDHFPNSLERTRTCRFRSVSGIDIRFIQQALGHVRLETTKIYTKVAVLKDEMAVSPLDQLLRRESETSSPKKSKRTSVGRLRIEVGPHEKTASEATSADVRVSILSATKPVLLDGIVVSEGRPGWLEFSLPPEEAWQDGLRQLTAQQRERIESPEFYELLQREIGKRFFTLHPG
jgi:hypothetical protein